MSYQNLLWKIDSEINAFWTCVILELAAYRKKSRIIASYYLVLDESLLESVCLFEGTIVFLKNFKKTLVNLFWYA